MFRLINFDMCMGVLPASVSGNHIHAVSGGQKRVLEFQTVAIVMLVWVLGTEPRFKTNKQK